MDAGTIWDPGKGGVIEEFLYPAGGEAYTSASLEGLVEEKTEEPEAEEPAAQPQAVENAESLQEDLNRRLEEEKRRAFEAGRQQGVQAEQEAHRLAIESMAEERKKQSEELLASFLRARDEYYAKVESEVVRLALKIAARILRRESQMDPLLLTGAVRVALGQLSNTTQVKLRVPAQDLELWKEAIEHIPNLSVHPEVVADAKIGYGECVVETNLGTVDLGLGTQLAEIERGFFDRVTRARVRTAPGEQQDDEKAIR